MGATHALEVLHALVSSSPMGPVGKSPSVGATELPFPHLQQRLQQSMRGLLLTVVGGIMAPILIMMAMSVLPLATFAAPGLMGLAVAVVILVLLSLSHVLLRNVLLPASSRAFLSDHSSTVYGWTQTLLCILVEVSARVYQEPQLPVLLAWSVFQSWAWKQTVTYAFVADSAVGDVGLEFSAFVWAGGLVSFASFLWLERRMGEDPFVLDPRSMLEVAVLRNAIRALRRGVLVWILARFLLFVTQNDSVSVVGFSRHRAVFQITSSTIENFVLLTGSSVFRILMFRANYAAMESVVSKGAVWDVLAAPSHVSTHSIAAAVFDKSLPVSSEHATPLSEQYAVALKTRMDDAVKLIATRSEKGASPTFEHVKCLELLFKFTNLSLVSRFDASCRQALFASESRWKAMFQSATSVLDSFTLSMQLLNSIPERKTVGQEREIAKMERSVVNLLEFLVSKSDVHPLLVLDAHPYLSNLRISSRGYKSQLWYFFESRAQFAVRRYLVEEARHRVFVHSKAIHSCQQVLCHLISASRKEDTQGNVQYSVPAVLSSLIACRTALETYIDMTAKIGNTGDVYVTEAKALAKGLDKGIYLITDAFYNELSSFTFAPNVKQALELYTGFSK